MFWMVVHSSNTYSSEPQPGVYFSSQIHKFKVTTVALDLNAQGGLKYSYMFVHRCSPSTCLRDCGELGYLFCTTVESDGAGWHLSLTPFIAVSLSTFPTWSTASLSYT